MSASLSASRRSGQLGPVGLRSDRTPPLGGGDTVRQFHRPLNDFALENKAVLEDDWLKIVDQCFSNDKSPRAGSDRRSKTKVSEIVRKLSIVQSEPSTLKIRRNNMESIDQKSGHSHILPEDMKKAVEEAFQHMDDAISAADFSTKRKTSVAIPRNSSASASTKIQQNDANYAKISNQSGKVCVKIGDLPYSNGHLNENWPNPKIRQTKVAGAAANEAPLAAVFPTSAISLEIGKGDTFFRSRERGCASDANSSADNRQSTLILSNLNSPRNGADYYEYKPKTPLKNFEDEYYAKEMKNADEYLHTIKFGYSDVESKDCEKTSVLNRFSMPHASSPVGQFRTLGAARKPQPEKRRRHKTAETRDTPPSATAGRVAKIGDLYGARNGQKTTPTVQSAKVTDFSPFDDVDSSSVIYSTVKQQRYRKECEKLKILLEQWEEKSRVAGLTPKRGSDAPSTTEKLENENLKKKLLEQHEIVQKLGPPKSNWARPCMPPDFYEKTSKIDDIEANILTTPIVAAVPPVHWKKSVETPEISNVKKTSPPYAQQRRNFYNEFSRSKSPDNGKDSGGLDELSIGGENFEVRPIKIDHRCFDVPVVKKLNMSSPLSPKSIDFQSEISHRSTNNSVISQRSPNAPISPSPFTTPNIGGASSGGLLSCSSLRQWNFRRPLTSSALQPLGDPATTASNWQSANSSAKPKRDESDEFSLSETTRGIGRGVESSGDVISRLMDPRRGETVYRTEYEKVETTTLSTKKISSNEKHGRTDLPRISRNDVEENRKSASTNGQSAGSCENSKSEIYHFDGVQSLRKNFM